MRCLTNLKCSVAQPCPTLWPHGLQHVRLPGPSLSPWVCSNSCPLSRWWHPSHLIFYCPLLLSSTIPSIGVFSNELALRIKWPKPWSFSFSISPSNEYTGLVSFRTDWLDLLAVQETLKSVLHNHSSKAANGAQPSLWFSFHIHTWLLEKP